MALGRKRIMTQLARSPLSYIGLFLLGTLFVYGAIDAYGKSRRAEAKLDATEAEHAELEDQKARLSKELENANTPFGEEKALREKFNVIKEGEKIIVIVPDQKAEASASLDEDGGLWGLVKKFFKK